MSIPNPNPNISDGIKCDNKTYSSNKIESLIKTATELPIPEAGDAGKVLAVDEELGYGLEALADVAVSGAYSDLSGAPELAAVATSGSYDDLEDKPTIPVLPALTLIDKADFFTDATNVGDFIAYQYGKIVIVLRCVFNNVSYQASGNTILANVKDAYIPAGNPSIRIPFDDTYTNTCARAIFDGSNKRFVTVDITSSETQCMLYAFTYVTV